MADDEVALMAHLLRRAGVGATREELDTYAARPYEDVVEDLINPERFPEPDDDVILRYFPALTNADTPYLWSARWIYRMVNTQQPLREKMALFWHHVFATAWFKGEHGPSMPVHVQMFRDLGLANMRELLLALSRDPAMVNWLDNCESHATAPNENYGRELLELFSMGVGNYSEDDIKNAAHAFTGWTFEQPIPLYPYGGYHAHFVYKEEDHDDSEKTFLGETGRFNGADIIDIIVRQPATGKFIGRHLYNFFVADEPGVSAWSVTEPQDPDAVAQLEQAFLESDGDLRAVMRVLFTSDFFQQARFQRVKCPAEFIAGVYKLSGEIREPDPQMSHLQLSLRSMGQALMDPPSVEGWHTGKEWIDGGTLMERVNFAVDRVADPETPGTASLIERLAGEGSLSPEQAVDRLLDLAGPLEVAETTRAALVSAASEGGDLRFGSEEERDASAHRIARLVGLVVAAPEYQYA